MGANIEASNRPARTSPTEGLPPGPEGWEAYASRVFWSRVEAAVEDGGDPGDGFPSPSDLETLVSDALTALYGPRLPNTVPDRHQGDGDAERAYRRLRERHARAKRMAALHRITRRFPYPIHRKRWPFLESDALDELDRREEETEGRTPWWIRPDAVGEARRRAMFHALSDPRVQGARVEELEGRLRSALEDAFGGDVVGPTWRRQSDPRGDRVREELTDPEELDEREDLRAWHDRDRTASDRLTRLREELDREERELLDRLRDTGANLSAAARSLGWTRWRARQVLDRLREKAQAAV